MESTDQPMLMKCRKSSIRKRTGCPKMLGPLQIRKSVNTLTVELSVVELRSNHHCSIETVFSTMRKSRFVIEKIHH